MRSVPSPRSHTPPRSISEPLGLQAEVMPGPGREDILDAALHLLAAWAVRAARAQTEAAADRELPPDVTRRTHEPQEQD